MKQMQGKSKNDYIEGFSKGYIEFETLQEAVEYVSEKFDIPENTAKRKILTKKNNDWILFDDGSVIADEIAVKAAEFLGAFPYGEIQRKKMSEQKLENTIIDAVIAVNRLTSEYCEVIRNRDFKRAAEISETLNIKMFEINEILKNNQKSR